MEGDVTFHIRQACWPEDLPAVRELLSHYAAHLADSSHGQVGICIEGFQAELDRLPSPFDQPGDRLLLACVQTRLLGCVALHLRQIGGERLCELKRMWTEPALRGRGAGRALVAHALLAARAEGCAAVVLDTHPEAMPQAVALYRRLGFREIERYNSNPVPGISFFRLDLTNTAEVQ